MSNMENIRHELLSEIENIVISVCKRFKFDDHICKEVGVSVVDCIGDTFGGQNIYFPMDLKLKIKNRDKEIYQKFTGNNLYELAREFSMTESGIRKSIARTRKKLMNKEKYEHSNI